MIALNCDGGSRGNPGPAAIGGIIRDSNGKILDKYSESIGVATNNVAEYKSLIQALGLAKKYGKEVKVFMDSQLIVRQMKGEYKVKSEYLKPLYEKVRGLERNFSKISYEHVYREDSYQQMADALVNKALD